jgi:N-acyl-D-amino-acid deacylase
MRLIVLLALTVAACAPRRAPAPTGAVTTLIMNARLIDGSGSAARPGSVRIAGDRIAEVGTLRARPGERVIDAGGLVVAPGFIDTHSHHDRGVFDMRDAVAAVSQGIGIRRVWVNGELVYDAHTATGRHPGRVLRRAAR